MIYICYFLYSWTLFWSGWYVFNWVSKLSLPLKKLLPVSLVSALIITLNLGSGTIVDVAHLLLIEFIFFKYQSKRKLLFYAFYTTMVMEFLLGISYFLIFQTDPNQIDLQSQPFYLLIIANLLTIAEYWIVHKTFNMDFKLITESDNKRVNRFLVRVTIALFASYILLHIVYLLSHLHNPAIEWISTNRNKVILVGVVAFCWYLFGFARWARSNLRQDIERDRELHIANLESYNRRVESLYDELNTFKRSYQRALEKLAKSIASQDMAKIKKTYDEVLGDAAQNSSLAKKVDVGKLASIHISPIKSMLSSKMILAQEAGLDVTIEAPDEIETIPMKVIDLVTIIGILCDNAIEAAQESTDKTLSIAYFKVDNQQFFVVENATKEEQVPISHIFDNGYSSKGPDRGIGLANVERIISEYENVSLATMSNDYLFRQTLSMNDRRHSL
ncbi:GHKL domain-containing protein [Streptococcus dentasini]